MKQSIWKKRCGWAAAELLSGTHGNVPRPQSNPVSDASDTGRQAERSAGFMAAYPLEHSRITASSTAGGAKTTSFDGSPGTTTLSGRNVYPPVTPWTNSTP